MQQVCGDTNKFSMQGLDGSLFMCLHDDDTERGGMGSNAEHVTFGLT